jgi:AraC family transcriptional regulator
MGTIMRRPLRMPFGQFYGQLAAEQHCGSATCAVLSADPYRIVERHTHEDAHFVLVLEGLYASSAAGAPALHRGPLLVFNPAGTTHRDRFEADGRLIAGRFMTLSVAATAMSAATQHRDELRTASVIPHPDVMGRAQALASMVSSGRSATLERESLALALVDSVFQVERDRWREAPTWLDRALQLLSDCSEQEYSVADIAREAGVHPVHLARVFRRFAGCSPGTYQRRRRIERASTLLRFTSRNLSDIATSCGFVDQSHFTNTFRRHTGVSPARWRQLAPQSPGS